VRVQQIKRLRLESDRLLLFDLEGSFKAQVEAGGNASEALSRTMATYSIKLRIQFWEDLESAIASQLKRGRESSECLSFGY
jgi:hypothetical protein